MAAQWLNRLSDATRYSANRFFAWGQIRTSTDPVVKIQRRNHMEHWEMRKPFYFPDTDTFAEFLRRLTEVGSVTVTTGNKFFEVGQGNEDIQASLVAKRPVPDRQSITISLMGETVSGQIEFRQRAYRQVPGTKLTGIDNFVYTVANILVAVASPMPRKLQKKTVPLLEPITAERAAHNRHDAELTKTARRSGALWGFITALAVAIVTIVIPAVFSGN